MTLADSMLEDYLRLVLQVRAVYHITVNQKKDIGEMMVTVDGAVQENRMIVLENDGVEHDVQVTLFTGVV